MSVDAALLQVAVLLLATAEREDTCKARTRPQADKCPPEQVAKANHWCRSLKINPRRQQAKWVFEGDNAAQGGELHTAASGSNMSIQLV